VREPLDRDRLLRFLSALGAAVTGPGKVYLTGGATAVSYGWRTRTIDVDLRLDPEPAGAFDAIARLKDALDLNVELASPPDFIPEVPGWRERSIFVMRVGPIEVYHYDPVSQLLAKLARGFERDLVDAAALLAHGLTSRGAVAAAFAAIASALPRYPRLDIAGFTRRVQRFVAPEEAP
jgi:hypothetical protein